MKVSVLQSIQTFVFFSCRTALLRSHLNQTVAASEESLEGCDVHIENCRRSTIYLLAPLKSVVFTPQCGFLDLPYNIIAGNF